MNRRNFIFHSSGLLITVFSAPSLVRRLAPNDKMDRLAMGTLLWRTQFKETKPKETPVLSNELTLLDIPEHHRDKFGIKKLEFWSEHFESLDQDYLAKLKEKIR